MLYGLDLISQDDGNETRYLLADGLGSVRVEMVDDTIETTTTYAPFGNLLQQTGTSGTVYGFTGEQYDTSTEQLYLRARYYNPGLHTFMGKDPWTGNRGSPQSMNGWSYVENNPGNLTDFTGMFPDYCREKWDKVAYVRCVAKDYDIDTDQIKLERYRWSGKSGDTGFDSVMDRIKEIGTDCFVGGIPYRGPGYSESLWSNEFLPIGGPLAFEHTFKSRGIEIAYDFATFESRQFRFEGRYLTDSLGWSYGESVGLIRGFKSWSNITDDYSGETRVWSLGMGFNFIVEVSVSIGLSKYYSLSDPAVHGHTLNVGILGIGFDPLIPVAEPSASTVNYEPFGFTELYVKNDGTADVHRLWNEHIAKGYRSPWVLHAPAFVMKFLPKMEEDIWGQTINAINKYSKVYNEMHHEKLAAGSR